MKLRINGNETEFSDNLTVAGLLDALKVETGRVAVEVNLKIVKKADYDTHNLENGDAVEIVSFVGGG